MKKKHTKRKSKKHCRTKSSNPKTSRFCVVNQEDQFKWELSDTMAEYANDHLSIFIQEKDLKGLILRTIPFPSKLQEVRRMYEFIAQLLKEKQINLWHNWKRSGWIYGTTPERETTENLTSSRRYLWKNSKKKHKWYGATVYNCQLYRIDREAPGYQLKKL